MFSKRQFTSYTLVTRWTDFYNLSKAKHPKVNWPSFLQRRTVDVVLILMACHNTSGPGINGPGRPIMSSYLVQLEHLCMDINDPGKT